MNEMLQEWYLVAQQLGELKEKEKQLRESIFGAYFPLAEEGTNNFDLGDGFVLKGKRVITRNVDKGSLSAITEELREAGVDVDAVIDWQPKLKVSVYRKLKPEQIHILDQALVIKDGIPGLEITAKKG